MEVRCFTGGNFLQNGYVVWCDVTGSCVIVDPGAAALDMIAAIKGGAGEVTAVLLTHAHIDHIEGLGVIRDYTEAPTYLHPADREMFNNLPVQAAMLGMSEWPQLDPPERALEDGEEFCFGESMFKVVHTPGHSPGHVILHSPPDGLALVGDLVFAGSVGRTDLPGGDYRALFRSIRKHVLTMADDTRLFTGHGPATTVGHERTTNPFLTANYGGELA